MRPLKNATDAELEQELQIRKALKHQKEVEKRNEERRIYNLPENVKAREEASMRDSYARVLLQAINDNPGVTEETNGIWKIYGEDPNCDLGGYHHSPFLGKVEGTLEQAIKYAIKQPGCFGRGEIKLAEKEKIIKLGKQ